MSSGGGVTNVRWKKKGKGLLFVDKMSTILEDKHVRKKRGHICPEDTLRTILSVKKWTYFLGVVKKTPDSVSVEPDTANNSNTNSLCVYNTVV